MSYGITTLETGLSAPRLGNLIAYSHFCHELPGVFAEFGTMRGGSLEALARVHPDRKIYGIDGFEGLPQPGSEDVHVKGDFALTDLEYKRLVNHFFVWHPNVEVVKGYSPEVFTKLPKENIQYAFVHLDCDLYKSVNDALDYFYPRMVEGGMILSDDWQFQTTPGSTKALSEFDKPCKWKGGLEFANGIFCGQFLIIR